MVIKIQRLQCGCIWFLYPDPRYPDFYDRPRFIFRVSDCGRAIHYADLDPVIESKVIDFQDC